jgi:hypothetical protein
MTRYLLPLPGIFFVHSAANHRIGLDSAAGYPVQLCDIASFSVVQGQLLECFLEVGGLIEEGQYLKARLLECCVFRVHCFSLKIFHKT